MHGIVENNEVMRNKLNEQPEKSHNSLMFSFDGEKMKGYNYSGINNINNQ